MRTEELSPEEREVLELLTTTDHHAIAAAEEARLARRQVARLDFQRSIGFFDVDIRTLDVEQTPPAA